MNGLLQFTPLGLVGYGIMLYLLFDALRHWFVFTAARRAWRENARPLHSRRALLLDPHWLADLRHKPSHPLLDTVKWFAAQPMTQPMPLERSKLYLSLRIQAALAPIIQRSERLKSTAPAWGLLFTVLGVMLSAAGFAHGESPATMMGNLAPALGTTALGALVSILEKTLLLGRIVPYQQELASQGLEWLLRVHPVEPPPGGEKNAVPVNKPSSAGLPIAGAPTCLMKNR